MKTLEQLDKEYAEKRAELVQEHAIAASLPLTPGHVSGAARKNPYVGYEVDTLAEAIALADKFTWAPYVHCKGQYVHVCPDALLEDRERAGLEFCHEITDGTPFTDAQKGEGYSTFELIFWVASGDKYLRVSVRVKQPPHQWMPYCQFNDYDNVRRTPVRKVYRHIPGANTIHWGTGAANCIHQTSVWGDEGQFRAALTTLPGFEEN
jgi:hypothetical protein